MEKECSLVSAPGARRCKPCEGGVAPLGRDEAHARLGARPGWELAQDGRGIHRTFKLKDFARAMELVNAVAAVAEREGHHPDIEVFGWNKVRFKLSTHSIGGLSENDFILAEEIDAVHAGRRNG